MIEVNDRVTIDEAELQFDFMRYDVKNSPSLPEEVRKRLMQMAHNRITQDGILIVEAKQYRTQEQNRQAAIERLVELIRQASKKPKIRKRTRPSKAAKRKRLEAKRRRGQIKRLRRSGHDYPDE